MIGIRQNMGTVDRVARAIAGEVCVAVGVFAPSIVDDVLLNGLIALFGVVNIISASIRYCPVYAVGNITTIPEESSNADQFDLAGSRKIRTRIVLFAVAAVTVVLGLFAAVLFHVTHDLAMSKDLLRGEAAAVLAVELYKDSRHPDFSSQSAELVLYRDLIQ